MDQRSARQRTPRITLIFHLWWSNLCCSLLYLRHSVRLHITHAHRGLLHLQISHATRCCGKFVDRPEEFANKTIACPGIQSVPLPPFPFLPNHHHLLARVHFVKLSSPRLGHKQPVANQPPMRRTPSSLCTTLFTDVEQTLVVIPPNIPNLTIQYGFSYFHLERFA